MRPRLVDAATAIGLTAAAVNVGIAVLVAIQASTTTLSIQPGLVVAVVVITVIYSAAVIAALVLLRAGRIWARTVFTAVASLSLLTLFAPNALNLLVIVLLVIAVVVLYRRPVNDWIRALRGVGRA